MKKHYALIILTAILIISCVTAPQSKENTSERPKKEIDLSADLFTVSNYELLPLEQMVSIEITEFSEDIPDTAEMNLWIIEKAIEISLPYIKGQSNYQFQHPVFSEGGSLTAEIGIAISNKGQMQILSKKELSVSVRTKNIKSNASYSKSEDNPNIYANRDFSISLVKTITEADGLSNPIVRNVFISENKIFAASEEGINISRDGGNSWETVSEPDFLFGSHIWEIQGEGDLIAAALRHRGLAISMDGGETWSEITKENGLPEYELKAVYVKNGKVYAGTFGGLCIFEFNGNKWICTRRFVPPTNHIKSIFVDEKDNLFVGSMGGEICISDTSGDEWSIISGFESPTGIRVNGNNIYIASWGNGGYISSDYGDSWTNISGTTNRNDMLFEIEGTLLLAGKGGLSLSRDGGRTWESSNKLFQENYAISVTYQEDKLYVCTTEGIVIYDIIWEE